MTEVICRTLREANIARTVEWTAAAGIEDYTWRAAELAGEVGELMDLLVHPVSAASAFGGDQKRGIYEESSDVVICIDLTGMTLGLDPIPPNFATGSFPYSAVAFAAELGVVSGRLCNTIKKLERERRGWPGSRETKEMAHVQLRQLAGMIGLLASYMRFDIIEVTEAKFNATSEKVGLVTRFYSE